MLQHLVACLVAAAALMVDYLTMVAVSVTVGVQATVAFVPALDAHRVSASVAGILLLMVVNLRGVREAGAIFVAPTYLFIGSLGALVVWGSTGSRCLARCRSRSTRPRRPRWRACRCFWSCTPSPAAARP